MQAIEKLTLTNSAIEKYLTVIIRLSIGIMLSMQVSCLSTSVLPVTETRNRLIRTRNQKLIARMPGEPGGAQRRVAPLPQEPRALEPFPSALEPYHGAGGSGVSLTSELGSVLEVHLESRQ
ncbi:hypothetical protein NDU88_007306 [Pleurodeles waltl]|uniref:Uncharacterized protein n=1 Tax=Pleurodeles waltl TaxID=8319 RepID=A0AAV7QKH7_PLEWA|nr:hypothetical protein NDU88_007306 [Pleurodeles waltl]